MAREVIPKTFADRGIGTSTLLVPSEFVPIFEGEPGQDPVNAALRNNEIIPMEISILPPRLRKNQTLSQTAADIINLSAFQSEHEKRQELQRNTRVLADAFGAPDDENLDTSTVTVIDQFGSGNPTVGFAGSNFDFSKLQETAESLQNKVANILALPPLLFLVNPNSFVPNAAKRIDEQFAKKGWVTEHWGEEQDTIAVSGTIGGTYVSGFGLTRFHRRDSASFKDLMYLFLMYRNNGYIFEDNDSRRIQSVGSVRILYDSREYFGSFDEFSFTEVGDKPFNLDYEFTFTVRQTREIGFV